MEIVQALSYDGPMTKVLEQAFAKVATLSEAEQDAFGKFLMAEIEAEAEWNGAFASSQDELARMAREALAEYDVGGDETAGHEA